MLRSPFRQHLCESVKAFVFSCLEDVWDIITVLQQILQKGKMNEKAAFRPPGLRSRSHRLDRLWNVRPGGGCYSYRSGDRCGWPWRPVV